MQEMYVMKKNLYPKLNNGFYTKALHTYYKLLFRKYKNFD